MINNRKKKKKKKERKERRTRKCPLPKPSKFTNVAGKMNSNRSLRKQKKLKCKIQ